MKSVVADHQDSAHRSTSLSRSGIYAPNVAPGKFRKELAIGTRTYRALDLMQKTALDELLHQAPHQEFDQIVLATLSADVKDLYVAVQVH